MGKIKKKMADCLQLILSQTLFLGMNLMSN